MATTNHNIQVQNTHYRGIIKYSHEDWSIEAYDIQRNKIKNKDYTDLDIQGHSIYFLYGEDVDENLKVYVGRSSETENNTPLFTRLSQHNNSKTERYSDIWDAVIAISFKNLSFDEMRYLENYFYHSLLPEVRLNSVKPDTKPYTYESIQHKVEYIKAYVRFILKEDVFKEQKKQEEKKEVPCLKYSDEEIKNQGKRLVDKDFEVITEIQTPNTVIEQMLDLLPASIWNPNTKFLDLACKSGEYLKAIFNRLLASNLYPKTDFPNDVVKTLYISKNQLYGIALTDQSLKLSQENLISCPNIIKIDNFSSLLKSFDSKNNTLTDYLKKRFNGDNDMKFDIIIGNPPYQENNGGGKDGMSGNTIYDRFIDVALDTADTVCMVVKDNWMTYKNLENIRNKIINTGLVRLIDYPIISEVFNNVSVSVNIFLTSRGYRGDTHFTEIKKGNVTSEYISNIRGYNHIPTSEIELSVTKKILANKPESFSINIGSAYPFGVKSNGVDNNGNMIIMSNKKTEKYNIPILNLDGSGKSKYTMFMDEADISRNNHLVDKYKVVCGLQLHKNSNVITSIYLLPPNYICSGSFGLLFTSEDKYEAYNAYNYIRTKFFRCILSWCIDIKCTVAPYRFSITPNQKFTPNSDIDWSQSLTNIDQKLYKKYNLTPEEINYIEATIKSLDTEPKPTEPKPTEPKKTDEKPTDEKPSETKTTDSKAPFTMLDVAANFVNQQIKSQDTI